MTKEKMTIHRALSELKLINSRIQNQISEVMPTGIYQKDKLVNSVTTKEEFEKQAQSKYDSVIDLIVRRGKIKSAIVSSNQTTKVNIAGEEMTVADAIVKKHLMIIDFKQFSKDLESKYNKSLSALNQNNTMISNNLQQILVASLGKESSAVKAEEVEAISKPYKEKNEFHLFDPLKIKEKIEKINKQVANFEAEVDAVLSESNAITTIEV